MIKVHTAGLSDVGRVRDNNEDSLLIDEAMGLYVVADGMGGHDDGEVASRQAVLAVHEYMKSMALGEREGELSGSLVAGVLRKAVRSAAERLYRLSLQKPSARGMGTTLTALMLIDGKAVMAHVGDSRLYHYRDGGLERLSRDHTYAEMLLGTGACTAAELEDHPLSHVLTRSLGGPPDVDIDTRVIDIDPDDTFLLCSDGLTAYASDEELSTMLGNKDVDLLGRRLINLAVARGGRDNITVVVVRVEDVHELNIPEDLMVLRTPTVVEMEACEPTLVMAHAKKVVD